MKKIGRIFFLAAIAQLCLALCLPAAAVTTMTTPVISSGGTIDATGASVKMMDLKGQGVIGFSTGASGTTALFGGIAGAGGAINIEKPVGGSTLIGGSDDQIIWTQAPEVGPVKISFSDPQCATINDNFTSVTVDPAKNTQAWTAPFYAPTADGLPVSGTITIASKAEPTKYSAQVSFKILSVPPNCVPLGISRIVTQNSPDPEHNVEDAIALSWSQPTDPNALHYVPDIYIRVGDGTGVYTNEMTAEDETPNWVQLLKGTPDTTDQNNQPEITPPQGYTATDFWLDTDGNRLVCYSQVGAGLPEAYYKGLVPGALPDGVESTTGRSYLYLSWAVGKFNIHILGNGAVNQICLPFTPQDIAIEKVIGDQLPDSSTIWQWNGAGYDSGQYNNPAVLESGQKWSTGVPNVVNNVGYWIVAPIDASVTMVGDVARVDQVIEFGDKTLYMVGNSFSAPVELTKSSLSATGDPTDILQKGDTLWRWTNSASGGYDSIQLQDTNTWSHAFDDPVTNKGLLLPARGFWVLRQGNTPKTWKIPKPY